MSRRKAPEISLHPAPEDLMSFLDGELEDHETAAVRRHLQGCAECTRTIQQFAAITSRFSNETLAAGMGSTATSQPQLAASPGEPPRRAVPRRFEAGFARRTARWSFALPRSAAASIAILLVGMLVAHLVLSPRPVSARGLVDTARQRQQQIRQTHPTQVLQRNLRVTKTVSGKAVGTEHWASQLTPHASQDELVSAGESAAEIQDALPRAACRLFVPLSLEMLDCLLDAQPASVHVQERESEDGAPRFVIELASVRPNLSPLQTRWTLRGADWHLSMVEYRVAAEDRETIYRIEEESAALVPLPIAPLELSRVEPQPTISARVPAPPLQDLNFPDAPQPGIRLRAFEAIDAFEPALDEDLQLEEEPDGVTTVSGIVPSPDRKAQLESLLATQPGIRITVRTQSEAIAEALAFLGAQPASSPAPQNDEEAPAIAPGDAIRSQDPLLAAELATRFGSGEEGNALALRFGAAVLEETQDLAFRARWLERLENAFSAVDWQAMHAGERERFLALHAKWLGVLLDRHRALHQRVASILCPAPCPDLETSHALPAHQTTGPASLPAEIPQWKPALDAEIALLKTMFVDGAFAPAGTAQQAKSRWVQTSQGTSQALESTRPWLPRNSFVDTGAEFAAQVP
jgi:anti-sigma factor RsiW